MIARASHRIAYPARFQLVAAMNPCKCGGGNPGEACKRGPRCATDYQARISGPFLDRIDIVVELPRVTAADLVLPTPAEGSQDVRLRVVDARRRQRERLARLGAAGKGIRTNADVSGRLLEEIAMPDAEGMAFMQTAATRLGLSARGFHRALKVARTIADLDGVDRVGRAQIAEALAYRAEALADARVAA